MTIEMRPTHNGRAFACCGLHTAKALRHVTSSIVRVHDVTDRQVAGERSSYYCECGREATFFLNEVEPVEAVSV